MDGRRFIPLLGLVAIFNAPNTRAQEELLYVPVDPCRVADTRKSSQGVIRANTNRNFRISGSSAELSSQGGEARCVHPRQSAGVEPLAVAAYIIAVPNRSSSGRGAFSIYPSDLPPPPVGSGSTVNFTMDATVGNTTIVKVCTGNQCPSGGELGVLSRNSDRDVVIDIQGYFYSERIRGACSTSDLEGTWTTYIAESSVGASTCDVRISSSGSVVSGSCDGSQGPGSVTDGQLRVESSCTVRGSIFIEGTENFLNKATLSNDRSLITGIVSFGGLTTSFTATRF